MSSRLLRIAPLLVALCSSVALGAEKEKEKQYLDPINVTVPHISSDPSVKYDYDIVYVRAKRAGDKVLSVRELTKAYDGRTLWQDISFEIKRGERIGILGPNGSGKTTLLESLIGRRDADHGDIKWGANLNIGYYDQKLDDFNPDTIEQFSKLATYLTKRVRCLIIRPAPCQISGMQCRDGHIGLRGRTPVELGVEVARYCPCFSVKSFIVNEDCTAWASGSPARFY